MATRDDGNLPSVLLLQNDQLAIEVATGFGPRITALTPHGADNLLAELGDLGIDLDDGRSYVFRGGHRLWVAPEVPAITYEPDDARVTVQVASSHRAVVSSRGRVVEKTLDVTLRSGSTVVVEHTLTNRGDSPVEVSPWAITQFRPGGTAMLPYASAPSDEHGYQANHAVVGWPYTDWAALGHDPAAGVLHIGGTRSTPTKVGTTLTRGWLAYVIGGRVFAKFAETTTGRTVDLGAQAQVYANAGFVELETLGALTTLQPGASVGHRETWKVGPAPASLGDVPTVVEAWQEDL